MKCVRRKAFAHGVAACLAAATAAATAAASSAASAPEGRSGGLMCTDQMETQPYTDDLEPTAIADIVDAPACDIGATTVAI